MVIYVTLIVTITAVPAVRYSAGPILAAVAAVAVLMVPIVAIAWFNESTPVGDFLVGSFQTLSGLSSSRDLYQPCYGSALNSLFAGLLTIAVAPFGFVATIGVPVGLLATAGGVLYVLATGRKDGVVWGLRVLAIGLTCTVAAGLLLRFVHYVSGLDC